MITADEARILMHKSARAFQRQLNGIEADIKKAAKYGKTEINVFLYDEEIAEKALKILQTKGFNCIYLDQDQKAITINWKKNETT